MFSFLGQRVAARRRRRRLTTAAACPKGHPKMALPAAGGGIYYIYTHRAFVRCEIVTIYPGMGGGAGGRYQGQQGQQGGGMYGAARGGGAHFAGY